MKLPDIPVGHAIIVRDSSTLAHGRVLASGNGMVRPQLDRKIAPNQLYSRDRVYMLNTELQRLVDDLRQLELDTIATREQVQRMLAECGDLSNVYYTG